MITIIVGSLNPVKVAVVETVFKQVFPEIECKVVAFSAASQVPDQPIGDTETKSGAYNRASACRQEYPEADYFVGLEGGLEQTAEDYWVSAWMCVRDRAGKTGFGRTGAFLLPPAVTKLIKAGNELGIATDIVFNETNSKHKGGAVGVLTDGLINRQDFYKDALIFALIPFLKPELYQ